MTSPRTQAALPPRSGGDVALVVVTYVFLALSAAWFVVTANLILTGGNDATCTDVAPDRHVGIVVAVSAAGYLALVVPALMLLRKRKREWDLLALLFACLAVFEPCGGLGWIIFSIGMC